jgi:hypothetical protein
MTSTRRKSSSGFSSSTEETVETVEETPAEVMEVAEVVEVAEVAEVAEAVEEEVVVETKKLPTVLNNPSPVMERKTSQRNIPRFSTQR